MLEDEAWGRSKMTGCQRRLGTIVLNDRRPADTVSGPSFDQSRMWGVRALGLDSRQILSCAFFYLLNGSDQKIPDQVGVGILFRKILPLPRSSKGTCDKCVRRACFPAKRDALWPSIAPIVKFAPASIFRKSHSARWSQLLLNT